MSVQWTIGKAEMKRSPVVRGAWGGNSARGARAKPYRNGEQSPLQGRWATIEDAEEISSGDLNLQAIRDTISFTYWQQTHLSCLTKSNISFAKQLFFPERSSLP